MARRFSRRAALVLALASSMLAAALRADDADDQYAVAAGHYAAQRWELAVAEFRALVKDHPNDPKSVKAMFYLGEALVQLGKHGEAQEVFKQFLIQDPAGPNAAQALFRLGESALMAGDRTAAREALETFCRKNPGDKLGGFAEMYLGQIAMADKDWSLAVKIFRKLLDRAPNDGRAAKIRYHLAEAHFQAGDITAANSTLEEYLKTEPSGEFADRALALLAACQLRTGDNDKAAASFDRLVEHFPDSPAVAEAAWSRGQLLEKVKRYDAALISYRLIVTKHAASERFDDALLAAARLHCQLQQQSQAIELYEQMLRERPKSPQIDAARYGFAWALRDAGKQSESAEQFQKLHDDFRQSRFWNDATFRLADDALAAKQLDRAEQLVGELIEAKPPAEIMPHALYLAGQVAIAGEKWAGIAPVMNRLVREFPDSSLKLPAEYWMAEAAYRQGQFKEAGEMFADLSDRIAGRKEKWLAMIPLRRAQVLAQQKQWSEAQKLAATIEALFPDFSEQYEVDYLLGRAAAAQADFEAARKAYGKVIHSTTGGKTETAAMAQWMIGESFFHQENFEAAVREYLRVEILYPYPRWQAAALLQAGKCQEARGRGKDAAELYARLIKVYSNTEFTDEAKRRLAELEATASQTSPKR